MDTADRFRGLVDNFSEYSYHILGCGAIGSSAATQIVRMGGTKVHLYDMDTVGRENIGVSMYRVQDIGSRKVNALLEELENINPDCDIETYHGLFEEHHIEKDSKDIIVLGFDSMDSRKDAVEKIVKKRKPDILIDGRMGSEHYQQYVFKSPTIAQYMKTWYSDEEGSEEPCNSKATSYCSNMSGSFICSTIKKILKEEPYHKEMSFNFPTMMVQKKNIA
jgi:molybdopterin/thiamine biosynthesis adenylyltransferase